jgi:hypothetical protein
MVPVIRQLAEAERSPIAAIEEQYKGAARVQLRQAASSPGRIGQFEVRCKFARGWQLWHGVHYTPSTPWRRAKESHAMIAAAGMVSTQAHTMFVAMPQRTAFMR